MEKWTKHSLFSQGIAVAMRSQDYLCARATRRESDRARHPRIIQMRALWQLLQGRRAREVDLKRYRPPRSVVGVVARGVSQEIRPTSGFRRILVAEPMDGDRARKNGTMVRVSRTRRGRPVSMPGQ